MILDEETRRRRAASQAATHEGLEALLVAMRDPSWRVRKAAAARLTEAFNAQGTVERLLSLLGDPSDAGARSAAAEALVALGSAAVPSLVAAFSAGDARVRKAVLEVIAAGGLASASELLAAALADADANVRMTAVEAAARLKPADLPALLGRALGDPEMLVRFAALTSLPEGGGVPVARIVEAAGEPFLARAAVRALGRSGDRAALDVLATKLDEPALADEALHAIVALAERYPDDARAALSRSKKRAAEIAAKLTPDSPRAACAAALALGLLGDAESAPAILALTRVDECRESARRGLALLGAKGAAAIAARAADLSPADVTEVATALSGIPGVVDSLRALAPRAGDDARARAAVAAALAIAGESDGVATLVSELHRDPLGDEGALARESLEALAAKRPSEVIAALTKEPCEADAGRAAAAETLGSAGEAALDPLRKLLRDPSARVRRAALAGLARTRARAALEEGKAALDDEDGSVRTAALALLAALARPLAAEGACVPVLARRLEDRDLLVRVAAARALGAVGSPAALDALLTRSAGISPLMDLALVEALAAFPGDASANARLAEYACSVNPDVAALAARTRK